ncbi:MAG: metal ABC transporter substrate-binding protein [Candidatus Uhrbacteria bacterium]|nr:metal ABC transporter substrate-binding protein [Candidatus Uhrbacteria bacterium]
MFIIVASASVLYFSMNQPNQDIQGWRPYSRFYVHTTTNTLAHLIDKIGGDEVGVSPIISSDIEPHDFEPTANDVITGLSGDLFIMNGAGLDAWASTIVDQRSASAQPSLVVLDDSVTDPHFWLDPLAVISFVEQVRDIFMQIDAEHAEEYRSNAQTYIEEIQALDERYRTTLAACEKPEIVVAHDAFSYLADRYGFTAHAVSGISPEDEPSPNNLIRLTDLMHSHDLSVVFFEETASDRIAQVLADEVGATVEVLYTAEIIPAEETYISLMDSNLEKLAGAMLCQ